MASTFAAPSAPSPQSPGSTSSPGTTISDLRPTFSWSASSGATDYGLYIRDMTTNTLVFDDDSMGNITSYRVSSGLLVAGHQYRWNMRARDSSGWSSYSSYRYFQTQASGSPPSTPTISSPGSTSSPGTTITDLRPTFSWSASSGATDYGLYIRDMTSNTLVFDDDSMGNTTSYRVSSGVLVAGRQYRWNARAKNAAGWSAYSSYRYFQTQATAVTPSISSVSPTSMPASNSDQTLTIRGSNFVSGATLTFDPPTGSNLTSSSSKLTFVSSSEIRYQINNGNDAGTWSVRVNNPDGQSSSWSNFTVTAVVVTPSISSLSPTSMPASNSDQTLTIRGSNFVSGATLTFDPPTGSNLTSLPSKLTFVSTSEIRYQINNGNDAGTWSVRVNNPSGQSSGWSNFTVTAPPAVTPSISSLSPTSMPASNSDQTLTIRGSNFVSGATLTFDPPTGSNLTSNSSKLTFVSTSEIRYQINNGNDAGTWSVRVNNPSGQSSGWSNFTVSAPPAVTPSISSVLPTSMPASNSDQTLTIRGSNFVSGATLTFDPPTGSNLTSLPSKLTFVSSSEIRYQINNGNDAGTWSVRVNNPSGQSSGWSNFTVTTVISPPSVPILSHETPVWDAASAGGPAVRLNWTAAIGASSYEIVRNGTKIYPATGSYTGLTFYNITGLVSGQTYSYQVIARNAAGVAGSNIVTVGPMPAAPVALPGSFTLTHQAPVWDTRPPAGPAVELSWTASANASGYVVMRNGVKIFPTTGTFQGTTFRNETNLTPGVAYTYSIIASNIVGTRASNSITITMPAAPGAPSAPTNLAAIGGTGLVSLAWADNSTTETGFRVERMTGTTSSWSLITTTGPDIAAHVDRSVVNGTHYTYRVRANGGSANSAWSAEAGATPTAAGAPGSFTLTHQQPQWNNGAPTVTLNWTASSRALTYDVLRDGVLQQSGLTGLTLTSSSGLIPGQSYTYHVIARNGAGTAQSNFIRVTMPTGSTQAPGAFALRHDPPAWDDRTPPGPAVLLHWDAAAGADGYEVFRDGVRIFPAAGAGRFTGRSFRNETGMVGGRAYTYQIGAINGGGRTTSNEVTVTMPTANDTGIGGFSLVAQPATWIPGNPGRASIRLTWTQAAGSTSGYVIFRNGTRLFPASGTTASTTYQDISGLIPGQTYTYHISAMGSSGTPRISNSVRQTVPLDIASAFCDLSVADFTVGVIRASAGEQVPVTLRVQNAGPRASRPSSIRFFVSLDRNWSGDDLPCVGPAIDLDSIPPDDHRMSNPWPRLPSGLPPQNYFIVCRLDPDGKAGQTDVTNDTAGSLSFVEVSPSVPTLERPGFFKVPRSQTIRNGVPWPKLEVVASGTPPFRYQWKKDGVNIANATTSTYTPPSRYDSQTGKFYAYTDQEGAYTVIVSNDAGSAETLPAYLSLESPNPRPTLFNDERRLSWLGNFDPNLPSVVITHGWQPTINFASYYTGYPLDWMRDMANAIDVRLKREEGELPRVIQKANIFFFCWSAAHTQFFEGHYLNLASAGGSTDNEGALLAKRLLERLGPDYSQKIHFIGHSLGTVVNAHAAKKLNVGGDFQFTILDAPIDWKAKTVSAASSTLFPDGFLVKPLFFSNILEGSKVVLMDNYYGGSLTPLPPAVGAIVPGAGSNGGLKYSSANHSGVHQRYLDTIKTSVQEGFYYSILMPDYGSRPTLSFSLPKTFVESTTDNVIELVDSSREIISGIASGSRALVSGAWRSVMEIGGSSSSGQTLVSSATMTGAATTTDQTIVAYHLVVPKHALSLAFDFRLLNVADEDELQVWFNDTPLYRFSGEAFGTSAEFRNVEIGIESFAGKTGEIRFVLTSDQNTSAGAQIANLHIDGSPIAPSTAPRLAIAVPSAERRIPDGSLVASGTASRGTSKVWVRLNGGLPEQATGTLAWQAVLTDLRPGDNEIACWAEDETGVISEIQRRTFRRVVLSPLTVEVIGQGTVTRGFLGSTPREIDASFSLTATPTKGWMFFGWSGDHTSSAARVDFKMKEGMKLIATFVPNPFDDHAGTYMDHTEAVTPLQRAMIHAVTTTTGLVTLTLVHQGHTYRTTGQFDRNGLLSLYFNRTGQPPLSLHLAMEFATGELTGTLKEGGEDIGVVGAIRSPWTTRAPTPLPPRYTLVFDQPAAPLPPAYGYGTLTLTPAGAITWTGKLPDGSAVTQGSRLLSDNTWIMQVSTHRGKGWAGGTVGLESATVAEPVSGQIAWNKPATTGGFLPESFSGTLNVFGGVFQDLSRSSAPLFPGLPMQPDQMQMVWGSRLFSSPASTLLTLNAGRQFIFPTAGNSAVLNLQNGLLSGRLRNSNDSTSVTYQAVIVPGHTSAYGQFSTKTSTGAVLLKPAPGVTPLHTRFFDSFDDNRLDATLWQIEGARTIERNGRIELRQAINDDVLQTRPFSIASTGKLIIERRLWVRFAGSYSLLTMEFDIGQLPVAGISYAEYGPPGETQMERRGFFITRNVAATTAISDANDVSSAITPAWGRWINERVEYDPSSGALEYFIDGTSQVVFNIGRLPTSLEPAMSLRFTTWGEIKGQEQFFDNLKVTQEP